jgi:CheY-like chemotaxis protein
MATILIVDDRPSNRAYLMALLGFTEHRLLEAEDGAAALQLVRAERPELIITDILMPTMDGYEFVQRLRADRALAATRVIFYSAVYAERETVAMARSCGVQTVLSKPSDPQDIMAAVNAELGLSAAAPRDAQVRTRSASDAFLPAPVAAAGESRLGARLAAIEEMCLHLVNERQVEGLVAVFLEAAARILDADQLALCLLENDERTVSHLNGRGLDPSLLAPHATGTRLPGALLLSREPIRLVEGDPLLGTLPRGLPHCASFLGLPVRCLRNLYGWLYFVRAPSATHFSAEDERWARPSPRTWRWPTKT